MAGQEFMFRVLEDMRNRNEAASEQARIDRENARKDSLKSQILIKAYENKEISLEDLMRQLGTGELEPAAKLPSQAAPAATQAPK